MQDAITGLINPLIAIVISAAFFAIWFRDRKARHVLGFAGAYALLSVGFLWSQFTPSDGARLWLILSNIPYFLGTVLMIRSAAGRVGRRIPMPLVWGVGGLLGGMLAFNQLFPDNPQVDLYLSNTAIGILFMIGGQIIKSQRRNNVADSMVFWMLVITSVQFFLRPSFSFMFEGTLTTETYHDSLYYSLLSTVVAVNSLALALALIAACAIDTITDEREASARDQLSGLLTRGVFESKAMSMMLRAEEKGVPLGMVVADIDHFKKVNDIWGHIAGDHAIAEFGKLIGRTIRETDIAGRVGGEEFCILVWNCDESGAGGLAERLRKATAAIRIKEGGKLGAALDVRLTASFGVAEQMRGEDYRTMFARADAALYGAKKGGRDKVVPASEGRAEPAPARETQQEYAA